MVTKAQVIAVLKKVNDPEIGIDIYTMGLIYDIQIKKDTVHVKMTLTTPACPYGMIMIENAKTSISKIKGVKKAELELVFDPPWEPTKELRAMLGV
ncbi:MAG: metal-sulfur cluster assembly factor [Nanoarchaeota archaeon]